MIVLAGRPRDGLYEPVLADSEREAVADLLQYLENVCIMCIDVILELTRPAAGGDRLLFRGASSRSKHSCLFRECGPTAECKSNFRGNN